MYGYYRYGFNGQEKSDEIKGSGNSYTAEFWEYDPRVGRRWNVDPVVKVHESPFACFSNNPIWFSDERGANSDTTNKQGSLFSEEDIPKEKIEQPGYLSSTIGVSPNFLAQSFAYSRQFQKGVAGVTYFDLDENTSVAVTFRKVNTITVLPDGTNVYGSRIDTYYTVFRADKMGSIVWGAYSPGLVDIPERDFFNKAHNEIYSNPVMPAPGIGGGSSKVINGIRVLQNGAKGLSSLSYAANYGIKAYSFLKGKVSGAQVHHLIEQRFSYLFPELGHVNKWSSIILTKAEHVKFTVLWRQQIGLNNYRVTLKTSSAGRKDVLSAAREIYADYPEILKVLPKK
jgi:hypothetical protein